MENLQKKIRDNYDRVLEEIEMSVHQCGRSREDVRVVVVSKAQPVEVLRAAVAVGITRFGENYPEETVPKIETLADESLEWHMIGHLQSRKAGLVCQNFDWLHSLDRLSLAEKLERTLATLEKSLPVLLEFNVGGEEAKSGWLASDENKWEALLPEIERVLELPHLEVRGLMTMPPFTNDLKEAGAYFRKLVKLRGFLQARFSGIELGELSMGTSADYQAAVLEGATMVRIGQAILGTRPKKEKAHP